MSKALYNKYRPQKFDDLIGQEIAKEILINSIKKGKINNSYLFYGIRGTGKTTIARIFAKALNCENLQENGNPCNQCSNCQTINQGNNFDVIEIDAASNNGVDEIRTITNNASYHTTNSRYKVYIIDEVHMLSKSAFNAFLKTLEEPPKNVVFLLITTEINKIPDTILSRNIIINIKNLTKGEIKKGLLAILDLEKISYDQKALSYLELVAAGSLRDAVSFLEKILLFSSKIDEESVIKTMGLLSDQEIVDGLKNYRELLTILETRQLDIRKVLIQFIEFLTELAISEQEGNFVLLEDLIQISMHIKDPQLLFLAFKGLLVKDLKKSKTPSDSLPLKKEQIIEKKKINLQSDPIEEESKERNENTQEKGLMITDFVNAKHYLTIMFDSRTEIISKYKQRFKYLKTYLNKHKWSKYVLLLENVEILAAIEHYLIVGFVEEQDYQSFKECSLEEELLLFLKELLGEEVYFLPVLSQTWKLLNDKFEKLSKLNKRVSEAIVIPKVSKDQTEEYKKLFGDKLIIK